MPFHALVAEILLQRTRAANVVPVYREFVARFPHPRDLALGEPDEVASVIRSLGLRWRAPLLKQLGEKLIQNDGVVPDDLDALLSLPGVGPYSAAAYLGFHGGKRAVIVDANIVRWICRLLNVPKNGETRRKRWLIELADILTPSEDWKRYNYSVLDFTMQICALRPACNRCPVGARLCRYGATRQEHEERL